MLIRIAICSIALASAVTRPASVAGQDWVTDVSYSQQIEIGNTHFGGSALDGPFSGTSLPGAEALVLDLTGFEGTPLATDGFGTTTNASYNFGYNGNELIFSIGTSYVLNGPIAFQEFASPGTSIAFTTTQLLHYVLIIQGNTAGDINGFRFSHSGGGTYGTTGVLDGRVSIDEIQVGFPGTVGFNDFKLILTPVPEPSGSALLATAGIMLLSCAALRCSRTRGLTPVHR